MARAGKQGDEFAPVETGDVLYAFRENVWTGEQEPRAELYSRTVEAVRPRTILVSAPSDAPGSVGRQALRAPAAAKKGIVATTSSSSGRGSGTLYRTEKDAARALLELNQERVEKQAKELDRARDRLRVAHELFTRTPAILAALLVALVGVLSVGSSQATAAAGFDGYVSTPSISGRSTVTMSGYFKRTTAARRTTATITFSLYRATAPGATGTRIKSVTRTLGVGARRTDLSMSVPRRAASRPFVWFGYISYTVRVPGRAPRTFVGTGGSALYRVR